MSNVATFVPKKDPQIPDYFEVVVKYLSGASITIKAVDQTLINYLTIKNPSNQNENIIVPLQGNAYWQFITNENKIVKVMLSAVEDLHYDLNFTKIVEGMQKSKAAQPEPKKKK